MKISGIQKLTLLDFPDHVACTLFTPGCNFKCPFCHNSSLVLDLSTCQIIDEEEIFSFLKKRVGILDGVCITGGEPTLQKDLKDFIRKIKNLGYSVKLDTNGYRPEILKELVEENLLDYVAMDIKNSISKYPKTIGKDDFDKNFIKESIDYLLENHVDYEFRTTVVKEFMSKEDFIEIAKLIKGAKRYYLQAFRDSGSCIKSGLHAYSKEEMENFVEILKKYNVTATIRGMD